MGGRVNALCLTQRRDHPVWAVIQTSAKLFQPRNWPDFPGSGAILLQTSCKHGGDTGGYQMHNRRSIMSIPVDVNGHSVGMW